MTDIINNRTISICGLPYSGKTTYLAALWYTLHHRKDRSLLGFHKLGTFTEAYLNQIAQAWADANVQARTDRKTEKSAVSINLKDRSDKMLCLTFPDPAGESFNEMWETRYLPMKFVEIFSKSEGILLFINNNKTDESHAKLIIDIEASAKEFQSQTNDEEDENNEVKETWQARLARPQTKLVDLLQLLSSKEIDSGRKVAIMLTAWDKLKGEKLSPQEYLSKHLPLLDQYLRNEADSWVWRTYGISAQGGDYQNPKVTQSKKVLQSIEKLRNMDDACERIEVTCDETTSNDLTEPISWLLN